jgi:hypothetical protein
VRGDRKNSNPGPKQWREEGGLQEGESLHGAPPVGLLLQLCRYPNPKQRECQGWTDQEGKAGLGGQEPCTGEKPVEFESDRRYFFLNIAMGGSSNTLFWAKEGGGVTEELSRRTREVDCEGEKR